MSTTHTVIHTLDDMQKLDGMTMLACKYDTDRLYSATELIGTIKKGNEPLVLPAIVAVEASQHKDIRAVFSKISNRPRKQSPVEEDVEAGRLPLSALNSTEGLHQTQQTTFGNLDR